jgi:hypothetical protein
MAKFNAKRSNALIAANNKAIAATGATFVALVQDTLLAGIIHAQATGDCTPVLRTVQAMPKSNRRDLAVKYVGRYSPIAILPNAEKGEGKCGLRVKGYRDFDIAGATAGHWTDGAEKADAEALNLMTADKAIFALADRLERSAKKEGVNDNDRKLILSRVVTLRGLAKTAKAA